MSHHEIGGLFMVEEWGSNYVQRGDIGPVTKKLHNVVVNDVAEINEANTVIRKEGGFKNICFLSPGTAALGYINLIDSSGVLRIASVAIRGLTQNTLCRKEGNKPSL